MSEERPRSLDEERPLLSRRGATPLSRRGATPLSRRGATPLSRRGAIPPSRRGATPLSRRGGTPHEERPLSPVWVTSAGVAPSRSPRLVSLSLDPHASPSGGSSLPPAGYCTGRSDHGCPAKALAPDDSRAGGASGGGRRDRRRLPYCRFPGSSAVIRRPDTAPGIRTMAARRRHSLRITPGFGVRCGYQGCVGRQGGP